MIKRNTIFWLMFTGFLIYTIFFAVGLYLYAAHYPFFQSITPYFLIFFCMMSLSLDAFFSFLLIEDEAWSTARLRVWRAWLHRYRLNKTKGKRHLLVQVAKDFGRQKSTGTFILWGLLFGILTWTVEWAGVQYSWFFGEYVYFSTLKIFDLTVPVVIAFLWCTLVCGAYFLTGVMLQAHPHRHSKLAYAFVGATILVFFDILLEVFAIRLEYWEWQADTVPISNYRDWWILSLVGLLFFPRSIKGVFSSFFLILQSVFMLIIILF